MSYKLFFYYVLLLPVMLIDAHISNILKSILGFKIEVISFLLLVFFFAIILKSNPYLSMSFSVFYGMLYDYYYFNQIGNMIVALPLMTFCLILLLNQMNKRVTIFQGLLLIVIYILGILTINFFIANLFQVTPISWSYFMVYQLLPTLFLNVFFFVIIVKYFKLFIY